MGLADMASAARADQPHRASGTLAMHVLDVMHAIFDSSRDGRRIDVTTSCVRPDPLPHDWRANTSHA
jgi:hypothetical protein